MNSQMLADLEKAIDKVIEAYAEEGYWDGYIHPQLSRQMTNAAAMVFDATMDGQEYAEREKS